MLNKVQINLESPELYQTFYQVFLDQSDQNIPESFSFDHHIRFQLIHHTPEELNWIEKVDTDDNFLLAYLDDRYPHLKVISGPAIKTIWYNPGGEIVKDEMPVQDVDIGDYVALKDALTLLHKPSLEQCLAWWEEWDVPVNIRRHSSVVARSAYVLAVKMRDKGISLDPILAHRAGLVHDLDKIDTLEESAAHGAMGADFLIGQGYPEMGKIVREHIMSTIANPEAKNRSWENKLVFFCDKLVEGDKLVPFDQRLKALKSRYPYYIEKMAEAEPYIWNLSDEICEILGLGSHEGLVGMLREMQ